MRILRVSEKVAVKGFIMFCCLILFFRKTLWQSTKTYCVCSVFPQLLFAVFCVWTFLFDVCVCVMLFQMKVDPSLQVDTKTNPYSRRVQMDKLRGRIAGGSMWQKRRLEDVYR